VEPGSGNCGTRAIASGNHNKEATMVSADQIKERMEIVGNDGKHVGIVDRVENDELRLSKADAPDRLHHFLPLANVEYVDDRVHLNRSSIRAMVEWR
jgi:hypothetical protein